MNKMDSSLRTKEITDFKGQPIRDSRLFLSEEQLENLIEHALRIKDIEDPRPLPKSNVRHDYSKPEDVARYIAERLCGLNLYMEERKMRELDFWAGVLGKIFSDDRGIFSSSYSHFAMYKDGLVIGNQVDTFLERLGYSVKPRSQE